MHPHESTPSTQEPLRCNPVLQQGCDTTALAEANSTRKLQALQDLGIKLRFGVHSTEEFSHVGAAASENAWDTLTMPDSN